MNPTENKKISAPINNPQEVHSSDPSADATQGISLQSTQPAPMPIVSREEMEKEEAILAKAKKNRVLKNG